MVRHILQIIIIIKYVDFCMSSIQRVSKCRFLDFSLSPPPQVEKPQRGLLGLDRRRNKVYYWFAAYCGCVLVELKLYPLGLKF